MVAISDRRSTGARMHGEYETMRHAARNLRFCEMRLAGAINADIAKEVGMSTSRMSRITAKGEEHWRRWLDRAIEEAVEQVDVPGTVPDPKGERVEMIDVTQISANPFQPRKRVRTEDVLDLMRDVMRNRLHHPILLRSNGSGLQLGLGQLRHLSFLWAHRAFAKGELEMVIFDELGGDWQRYFDTARGHTRIPKAHLLGAAWDEYHDSASGVTRIPGIVREMTDEELIIASLSENLNRNTMVWSDETRALDLAVQQPGMTARQVAAAAKMSPSQLSNRRRLLKLSDRTLSLIDDGILSWTAARELLAFAPDDHIHQEELDYCEKRLWSKHREYVNQGRSKQPLTAKQVLTVMANALNVDHQQWEQLGDEGQFWIRGNHYKEVPQFDVDAFRSKVGDFVHTLPYLWGTDPFKVEVTCVGWRWREWQEKATAAEREQREKMRATHGPFVRNDADSHDMCAGCGIPETAPAIEMRECSRRYAEQEEAKQELAAQVFSTENTPSLVEMSWTAWPSLEAFVSENPDVVHLPHEIAWLVHDGKISRQFCEELLGLEDQEHSHKVDLDAFASWAQQIHGDLNDTQAAGAFIRIIQKGGSFRSLDDQLTRFGFAPPRMSLSEWDELYRGKWRHSIPMPNGGYATICCASKAWDDLQALKVREVREQVARGNTPTAPEEPAAQLQDMSMADSSESPLLSPEAGLAIMGLANAIEQWTVDDNWRNMGLLDVGHIVSKMQQAEALLQTYMGDG